MSKLSSFIGALTGWHLFKLGPRFGLDEGRNMLERRKGG